MKAVITIFQYKRVALPYIFIRYCYPKMQQLFPGQMKVFLIQYIGKASENLMQTSKIDNSRLELVRQWTKEGRYDGAEVVVHSESFSRCPPMPSYRIGVENALREKSDFHIWLEDDAIIYDEECDKLPRLIGNNEVGVYTPHYKVLCPAYLITTPSFDERVGLLLKKEILFRKGPASIENVLTANCKSEWSILNPKYAARFHGRPEQQRTKKISYTQPSSKSSSRAQGNYITFSCFQHIKFF